jgi:LysM repeat protein
MSAPSMQQLADQLRQQAASGPVTIDATLLGRTDLTALLQTWLVRANVKLLVNPTAIPASPPATGFSVPAQLPAVAADTFFALTGRDCTLTFVVNGSLIDFTLAVTPQISAGAVVTWTLGQSFGMAATLFDNVPFTSPTLTFTTYQVSANLPVGLNFAAPVTLIGVLADVTKLLTGATSNELTTGAAAYQLAGSISQQHGGSAFDLTASLFASGVGLGFIHISSPYVGLQLEWVQDNTPQSPSKALPAAGYGTAGRSSDVMSVLASEASEDQTALTAAVPWKQVAAVYVGADVKVSNSTGQSITESILAVLPFTSGRNLMSFIIQPTDGIITSISDLGSLLAGNDWNTFFDGPASVLKPYVDSFGLERLTVRTALSSLTVVSLMVQAGIDKPWRFFDNLLVINSFDVQWLIIAPASTATQSAIINTQLELFNDPDLTFDIEIDLPDLVISGWYNNTVSFTLADLVTKFNSFFGVGLPVPPSDLAEFSFSDFSTTIDVPNSLFMFSCTANAALNLFGLELLGMTDTVMSFTVDRSTGAKVPFAASLNGVLTVLGIDFSVSASYGASVEIEIHLVDTDLGQLLNHLVHLVDPTYDISLPSPWSKLLEINLDALVLKISDSDTSRTISLTYQTSIDLIFVDISGISLVYTKVPNAGSTVAIELEATFLGVKYGSDPGLPGLGWDAVNGSPPAVPGQGGKLFELDYLGLGQHIAFGSQVDVSTINKIMTALRNFAVPTDPGKLPAFGGANGLVFDADSHWLIGAQFSVMDTVAISAIFNDPDLYGILIQLSGAKAQIFAGLSFEILYRKVTDTIGVYHIELKLPDAMRHLEFGEVSITLPVVVLDIYTNGNFRIDFGFPKGLDFSNSFSIQVFPFVGYGGFYFALLDGATSSRVPQITNGTWAPVIEFGIALSIGAGKTIDAGILTGGISVTVVGIVQGVLGWFNPSLPAPKETYYWVQGTIAVVGRLYASINFAIIQASVDVTAYISVTLTIEAHQPIHIEATASVSVRVSIKIIFFTIHLSFSATVNASFTIGSASPTPWTLASGGSSSSRQLRGMAGLHSSAPRQVRQTRALRQLRATAAMGLDWPAVLVFGQRQDVTVLATPAFTKAETWAIGAGGAVRASGTSTITTTTAHDLVTGATVTITGCDPTFDGTFSITAVPSRTSFSYGQAGVGDLSSGNGEVTAGPTADGASAVLLLVVRNSIDAGAVTLAEHRLLAGAQPAEAPFNLLMDAMLRWGILVVTGTAISTATRTSNVVSMTTVAPHGLTAGQSITVTGTSDGSFAGAFTITAVPNDSSLTYAEDGPDGTATGGVVSPAAVTADQLETLRASIADDDTGFEWPNLAAFLAANFSFDLQPASSLTGDTGGAVFPMLPVLTLTDNQGLSIDFATKNQVDTDYPAKIGAYFTLLQAQIAQRAQSQNGLLQAGVTGPSAAEIIAGQYFKMLLSEGVNAAIDYLAAVPYPVGGSAMSLSQIATAVDPSLAGDPMRLISPVQDKAVLAAGAVLNLPDVRYQVRSGNTFATIAQTFASAKANDPASGPFTAQSLLTANSAVSGIYTPGTLVPISGISYQTVADDTLNLVSVRLLVRVLGASLANALSGQQAMISQLLQANPSLPSPLPAGTAVTLPTGGSYLSAAGDTVALIADYLLAMTQPACNLAEYIQQLLAANPGLSVTDPTAPQPAGTTLALPAVSRVLNSGDSMASLASLLLTELSVVQTAFGAVAEPVQLLAAQAVLAAPLSYPVQPNDTLASIAATFDLSLAHLGEAAAITPGLFAPTTTPPGPLTIVDVPAIDVDALLPGLLPSWNNAAGSVSRFFLSGLRLPDPSDPYFAGLSVSDLLNPAKLAPVRTTGLFSLTGQQYPIASTAPSDYQLTLTSSAPGWVGSGGGSSLSFGLSAAEQQLLTTMASTALDPQIQSIGRLAMFQMTPPRIVLGEHIAWQAGESIALGAVPPSKVALRLLAAPLAGQSAAPTGNPVIWPFPDSLLAQVSALSVPSLYEVMLAKHNDPAQAVSATQASRYSWATVVNLEVAMPIVDGPTPAVESAYVVLGADDTGAALLQQLYAVLAAKQDTAELYLLYTPNPTTGNAAGLVSDAIDRANTFALKANLSTLGNPAVRATLLAEAGPHADDPTGVTAAAMSDAADFVALLWEASVTRAGGFYLSYAAGGPIPPSAFGSGSSAQLTLVAICGSQAANADAPLYPFSNAVVIGDNVDTATTSLFVQPAVYATTAASTLPAAAAAVNAAWGLSLDAVALATLNAAVPQVLQPGVSLAVPGKADYVIAYTDTLSSAVANSGAPDLPTLINANPTVAMLADGAQLQLSAGVLQPVTSAPAGMAGYELIRAYPDPAADPVASTFNLVGFSIAASGGFMASGAGLPTTPADGSQSGGDGLSERDLSDTVPTSWNYSQALTLTPFALQASGSSSPALPIAAANPYAGISWDGALSSVTLALTLQDIYGNIQPLPGSSGVDVPVGYYDELANLASWPSLAAGYLLVPGPPIALQLLLSMQCSRYVPTASVTVSSAQSAVAADLLSYTGIYYQLAQPDLTTTLASNLSVDPGTGLPRQLPLDRSALSGFVDGAYVFLSAMASMTPVKAAITGSTTTFATIADSYGVTGAQLLNANSAALYDDLFTGQLVVPQTYLTAHADTLTSIGAKFSIAGPDLAKTNAAVLVGAGTELSTPTRTTTASSASSLNSVASAAKCSVADLATSNADIHGLLATGVIFSYGTLSRPTAAGDRLSDVALALGATVTELAAANAWLVGVFIDSVTLNVSNVIATATDSLQSLAGAYFGGDLAALSTLNAATADPWAPGTDLVIGPKSSVTPAGPEDTVAMFAAANQVSLDELGQANAAAGVASLLIDGAAVLIPGTLNNESADQYSVLPAEATDTAASVATLFGTTAATIEALNPTLPGEGGVWLCPPMTGDAHGQNPTGTLTQLASLFRTDVATLAATNAANLGLLAPSVPLTLGSATVTTQSLDTLNSLVNRFGVLGVTSTVADLAVAFAGTPGLVKAAALVAPVPPAVSVAPVPITPSFARVAFAISVDVVLARDPRLIDPAFVSNPAVATATCPIVAEPVDNANGDLSLAAFATALETALPGVRVAVGDPAGEDDPPTARRVWALNFGNPAGPAVTFGFDGAGTQYFALPPLSTSLSGGTVNVTPYVSGQGLTGVPVPQNFHAVDLDVWLSAFASAVDTFLSPTQAVPAYALNPASTLAVIAAKRRLATALANRATWVFDQNSGGNQADAIEAARQAMLNQLSSAFSVSTIVQVPVTVTPAADGPAMQLHGQLVNAGTGGNLPDAFSFSTSSVALDQAASNATILFSVKTPADHQSASLDLAYRISSVELPNDQPTIAGYQGSQWLSFVTGANGAGEALGTLDIPVPLRSYPGPVSLAAQTAVQSYDAPDSAAQLVPWNLSFLYTHDDAEQDSTVLQVVFNPGGATAGLTVGNSADQFTIEAVLTALAQFIAVYPAVRADLAELPSVTPGTPNAIAAAAVGALATLVTQVADAFDPSAKALGDFVPTTVTYYYLVQKQQDSATGMLTTLSVTSVGASSLQPTPNPTALWPSVWVEWDANEFELAPLGTPTGTVATFSYPAGQIPATAAFGQRLVFSWPDAGPIPPPVAPVAGNLGAAQAVQFAGTDVLSMQSARAGVAIVRNLSLVPGVATNPAFVYQTPMVNFTSAANASVTSATAISIGAEDPSGGPLAGQVAAALGGFLHSVLWGRDSWQTGDRLPVRLSVGYSYPVAVGSDTSLDSLVPILLAPSVDFDPSIDCEPVAGSFVQAVGDAVQAWYDAAQPPAGAVQFDVTVYASLGTLQPLISASQVRFSLTAS